MKYQNIPILIAKKCECYLTRLEKNKQGLRSMEYYVCSRCKELDKYIEAIKKETRKNIPK